MKLFGNASAVLALLLLAVAANAALEAGKPTVLITGANRGIGLEFVRQFSERGWNIIATARKPDQAEQLQELATGDPNIVIEQLDVTDYERIEALAEKYKDQPIDILLNNAGLTPRYASAFKRVKGVDFDMAVKSYEVNALGPLKVSQQFMPHVMASEQKKIIVVSSKAGSFAESPKMPMMYSYRASKAALNMLMYALSFETSRNGVIVTMISPGTVNTTEDMKGMKLPPGSIEVEESVSKMLVVIDDLTIEDNGKFLNYEEGRVVGW
ncbi:MAG: SDR family oxidoreductase [Gammaproteobacteria bacterium]|nr:SDR family oxidoreductase [Gammaproteobacteria bacterium]